MAFDRENLTTVTNNVKSGVVAAKWLYVNQADDDVTAASYFSDLRLRAADVIEVVNSTGAVSVRYYVASVTDAGVVTLGGGSQDLVADGDIDIVSDITTFNTTAAAISAALADGTEGQVKKLVCIVDGGNNAVVTPTNFGNGTTLTFADVGDACILQFCSDGNWWLLSNSGVVVA